MLYSEDVPARIVYDFQYYCGIGDIEKIKTYLPSKVGVLSWFGNNKNNFFINKEEYPFAYWYGLESACGSNKAEVVKFLLEHQAFKKFKKKSQIEKVILRYENKLELCPNNKCESASDPTEYVFFNAPVINEINVSRCLEVSAQKGYFDLFDLISSTDIRKIINTEEIMMKCFFQLDDKIFNRLKKVKNINFIVNRNITSVLRNIIEGENKCALIILRDYFNQKITNLNSYFDSDFCERNKKFIDYAELELNINNKKNRNKLVKI